jgi:4-carboxymuconolactone decarboxylase
MKNQKRKGICHTRRSLLGAAILTAGVPGQLTFAVEASNRTSSTVEQAKTHQMPEQTTYTTPLDDRQRAIVPIAAFAASGNISKLGAALEDALSEGLSISEIKEVLVQVYAYAGFPRSLNALSEFMRVTNSRKARGIQDRVGAEPSQTSTPSPVELGTKNQTELVGSPVTGPLFDFAPAIDQFLKGHLFGDIFMRHNLNWQSREIATISMLSALDGVGSQLQSHFRVSMHNGVSLSQLDDFITVLSSRVDDSSANRAKAALDVFRSN